MVALTRIVPILVFVSPVLLRMVHVVPKLVEHSVATAVNAYRGVAITRARRENENAQPNTGQGKWPSRGVGLPSMMRMMLTAHLAIVNQNSNTLLAGKGRPGTFIDK